MVHREASPRHCGYALGGLREQYVWCNDLMLESCPTTNWSSKRRNEPLFFNFPTHKTVRVVLFLSNLRFFIVFIFFGGQYWPNNRQWCYQKRLRNSDADISDPLCLSTCLHEVNQNQYFKHSNWWFYLIVVNCTVVTNIFACRQGYLGETQYFCYCFSVSEAVNWLNSESKSILV